MLTRALTLPLTSSGNLAALAVWIRAFLPAFLLLIAFFGFYRLAVGAQHGLNVQIFGAIDLHRRDLLKSLHIERPLTPESEKALWASLSTFITQEIPPTGAVWFDDAGTPANADSAAARIRQTLVADWSGYLDGHPAALRTLARIWDRLGEANAATACRNAADRLDPPELAV